MTKPAKPTPVPGVVEIDAMDVHEWNAGQRTPQASDANLAALVRQSTHASSPSLEPVPPARPQFARTTPTSPRINAPAAGAPSPPSAPSPRSTAPRPAAPSRTAPPSGAAPGRSPKPSSASPAPRLPGASPMSGAEVAQALTAAPVPRPLPGVAPEDQTGQPRDAPRPRSRRMISGELVDTTPSPRLATTQHDAAPEDVAAFDDFSERTRVRPTGTPVQPPSVLPSAGGYAPSPGGYEQHPGGAAPHPGAAPLRAPFPSSREAGALQYPLAVPEPTAPPMPAPVRRMTDERPRAAPPRRIGLWIAGAVGVIAIAVAAAVLTSGGSEPVATDSAATRPGAPIASAAPVATKPAATKPAATTTAATTAATTPATTTTAVTTPAATTTAVTTPAATTTAATTPAPTTPAATTPAETTPAATTTAATTAPATKSPDTEPPRIARTAVHPTAAERLPDPAKPSAGKSTAGKPPGKPVRRVAVTGNRPARRPSKKPKRLIAEDTSRSAAEVPSLVAQAEEDPAIARARGAYISGNDKLFAGDTTGAIEAYREALSIYPGYVGGYRGLGLAYAQRGDHKRALDAFKTYVAAVPAAKDVPLIKKRISRLQHRGDRPPL